MSSPARNHNSEASPSAASPPASPRHVRAGWYLFDFANSFLIINGGLYFPQWIVNDNSINQAWFNLSIALTSLASLSTGPLLGALSDRRFGPLWFLRATSIIMFISTVSIDLTARTIPDQTLRGVIGLLGFAVIMYCYQVSLILYNAMLRRLSSARRWPQLSGAGLAAGWLGGILGVFAVLPFVDGRVPYFQPAGRAQAFLPSAVFFGLLTAASLWMLQRYKWPIEGDSGRAVGLGRGVWRDLRFIMAPGGALGLFLLSYFLFSDAIVTIQNNSTLYLEGVWALPDTAKALLFVTFLGAAAAGAWVSGVIGAKRGVWRPLRWVLVAWVVTLLLAAGAASWVWFGVWFTVAGAMFGAVWTLARAGYLLLVPAAKTGEFFGIYSAYERAASLFGPVIWSGAVALYPGSQGAALRVALVSMAAIIALSVLPLSRLIRRQVALRGAQA